jgi:PAS domain S-box-containing protein
MEGRAMSEDERRLRAILDHLPDVVLTMQRDGVITFVNHTEPGYSVEQVVGSHASAYLPEESRGQLDEALDCVFRQGETFESDSPTLRADGQAAHYTARFVPIRRGGRVVEALVVATDVTAHKQTEERLRAARADLQAQLRLRAEELAHANKELQERQRFIEQIADASPFILYVFDLAERRNLFVNSQIAHQLGYDPEAIRRMSSEMIARLVHPQDQRAVEEGLARVAGAEDGEVIETEYRLRTVDGQWRWYRSRDVVFRRGPDGSVASVLGTAHDVSERKLVEAELERFKFLSDHSCDAHFFLDRDGRFLYVNGRACEMLGYTEEELLGMQAFDVAPGSEDRVRALFDAEASERVAPYEVMHRRKDGTTLPVEISVTRATFAGEPYVFAAVRDVSDRKRADAALRQRDKLTAVGTLAAGLAHEVNNPLSALLTSASVAQRVQNQPEGGRRVAECLELIRAEGERIRQIVKNVARFAKQGSSLKCGCDVAATLEAACGRIGPYARTRGVPLECDIHPELPTILANATEIEQVVGNLLSNAIEASEQGSAVTLRARPAADAVLIEVEDQGRGMTEAEQERIFEPFYTGREDDGGTGLGLSIVHGIVSDHGGQIEVRTEPKQGTLVTIHLPLPPDEAS